jgi:DNA repair protein RadC
VAFLNSRNQIVLSETIFIGTLNQSLIHPREIFKRALEEKLASVIFLHNHPSGDLTPSKEDIQSTREL